MVLWFFWFFGLFVSRSLTVYIGSFAGRWRHFFLIAVLIGFCGWGDVEEIDGLVW